MARYNPAKEIYKQYDKSVDKAKIMEVLRENLLIEDETQYEPCLLLLAMWPLPFEFIKTASIEDALRLQVKWHNFASSLETIKLPMARKLLCEFYEEVNKYETQ